jgi:hypothetical protein
MGWNSIPRRSTQLGVPSSQRRGSPARISELQPRSTIADVAALRLHGTC